MALKEPNPDYPKAQEILGVFGESLEQALEQRAQREREHIEKLASTLRSSQELVKRLEHHSRRLARVIRALYPDREAYIDDESWFRDRDKWIAACKSENFNHSSQLTP